MRVPKAILALNAGSSSLKFGLFEWSAEGADFREIAASSFPAGEDGVAVDRVIEWVEGHLGERRLAAVGHRVVHGGPEFSDPVEINDRILGRLDALTPLAPLHHPASLDPVRRIREIRPKLRQFACFDTAFHRTIVAPASRYALPRLLEAQGIRRYGFHGLSYESIAAQLRRSGDGAATDPNSRIIVAHLGNGASLCAMRGLKSVDTTMGFSTLDGLVMGTRPGTLDPGILLYLLNEKGFTAEELEQLLYRRSGLLGVSGISADVAALLKSDAPEAAEAVALFVFQVARQAAGLAATLGGLDRIIFTGGIGEHAPAIAEMIVHRLRWLGAELDPEANNSGATLISTRSSSILIERRRTQEELMVARHVPSRIGIEK